MQRHACRKPEPHQAECEPAPPLEPLRDDVARAQEQAALSEKAYRREPEGEHHDAVHEPEGDGRRAEKQRHRCEHPARSAPIHMPPRIGQPEGGGEGGDPVRERNLGMAQTQVFRDMGEEDSERVGLPRAAREEHESPGGNHQPAVEEAPVDAVDERVGITRAAGRAHAGAAPLPAGRFAANSSAGGGGSARLSGLIRYQRIAFSQNMRRRSLNENRLVIA